MYSRRPLGGGMIHWFFVKSWFLEERTSSTDASSFMEHRTACKYPIVAGPSYTNLWWIAIGVEVGQYDRGYDTNVHNPETLIVMGSGAYCKVRFQGLSDVIVSEYDLPLPQDSKPDQVPRRICVIRFKCKADPEMWSRVLVPTNEKPLAEDTHMAQKEVKADEGMQVDEPTDTEGKGKGKADDDGAEDDAENVRISTTWVITAEC